jgi:hypothetical protein
MKLTSASLKLKSKKCSIGMQCTHYITYVVIDKSIEVDQVKVSAIKNMLPKATVRGVR